MNDSFGGGGFSGGIIGGFGAMGAEGMEGGGMGAVGGGGLSGFLVNAMERRVSTGQADDFDAMRRRSLSSLSSLNGYIPNYNPDPRLAYYNSPTSPRSPYSFSPFPLRPPPPPHVFSGRLTERDGRVVDSARPLDEYEIMYGKKTMTQGTTTTAFERAVTPATMQRQQQQQRHHPHQGNASPRENDTPTNGRREPSGAATPTTPHSPARVLSPLSPPSSVSSVSLDNFVDLSMTPRKDEESLYHSTHEGKEDGSPRESGNKSDVGGLERMNESTSAMLNSLKQLDGLSAQIKSAAALSTTFKPHPGYGGGKNQNHDGNDNNNNIRETKNAFPSPLRPFTANNESTPRKTSKPLTDPIEGASIDEGFRRDLEESLASVIRGGKSEKIRKKLLLTSEAEGEEEEVDDYRGYNPILYQRVLLPDENTEQIDDILKTLQTTRKAAAKNSVPDPIKRGERGRERKESVLTSIDQELTRFREEESYDAKLRRLGGPSEEEEDRHRANVSNSLGFFCATGEMTSDLAKSILESNTEDVAAALTDEDTENILRNYNFDDMLEELRALKGRGGGGGAKTPTAASVETGE